MNTPIRSMTIPAAGPSLKLSPKTNKAYRTVKNGEAFLMAEDREGPILRIPPNKEIRPKPVVTTPEQKKSRNAIQFHCSLDESESVTAA